MPGKRKNPLIEVDLEPIQKFFQNEPLPDLPAGPIGRFRLVQLLQHRHGENFRIIPGAREVLNHFDKETENRKFFVNAKARLKNG